MTRVYEFTLTLDSEPDLNATDRLYEYFSERGAAPASVQDFSLVTQAGTALAQCTVEAVSFDEALQAVLPGLRQEQLQVIRMEVDKEGLLSLQGAI